MVTRALKNTLSQNRNITLLNVHAAFQRFSNQTLDVFGIVYFLSLGISFPVVALAWAASLGIRFVLRPISVYFASRIGLRRALIIGTVVSSGLFPVFLLVDGMNSWLWLFSVYLAFYDILYWLPYNAFYAVTGDENARGKQFAIGSALIDLVQVAVPLLGAVLATTFGFWPLYTSATICMLFSVVPVLFTKDESPGEKMSFRQAMQKIDKRGFVMAIGSGISANAHTALWTAVLFLLVGNLLDFGGLVAFELLATAVLALVLGGSIDKGNGRRVASFGIGILAMVIIARSFWVVSIPQILLVNFVAAIGATFYSMAYHVSMYNLAKRTPNTLWFHFFAEAGWDIGGAFAFLLAAGLVTLGLPLQYVMLLALMGLYIVNRVLRSYYPASGKSAS